MSDKPASDKQVIPDAEAGALFEEIAELLSGEPKLFPLNLDGKAQFHSILADGVCSGPRPDSYYQSLSETALDLKGRDFAMLNDTELKRFRALRTEGRKIGWIVSVEVMNDSEVIQAELAAASPSQQEDIYRRLSTQISVRLATIDK